MSTTTLALLSALIGAAPGHARTSTSPDAVLGFRQVLEGIRNNNEALKAAEAGVMIADADVEKAWTAWQPKLTAIGQLTLNSVEAKFSVGQIYQPIIGFLAQFPTLIPADKVAQFQAGLAATPEAVIVPHVQWAGMLTLSQTLFNITVLRAPGVAKAARAAVEAGAHAAEDELLFGGATLYTTLAGLRTLEAATERAIQVAEKRIGQSRTLVEAGTQTRLALTRAETEKVAALGQREMLRATRRTLQANLAVLLGTTDVIEVQESALDRELNLAAVEGDYEQRSMIVARKKALAAAEQAVGLSQLSWLPTLAADGTLRYSNVPVAFSGNTDDKFLATATINLVVPLYDQGARYADLDAARARVLKAEHELENERLTARAFLEEAKAKLESAAAELAQAEAQLKLATEAVKQVESLAENGLTTSLELSDADSKRFGADSLLAQKRLELDLARLRRYYALGGRLLP